MNTEEELEEFKKYLIKLRNLINHEAIFSFNNNKIVNKKKVDDILCCIHASFPKAYIEHRKKHGNNMLKTETCYKSLIKAIKNKFLFCNNVYLAFQTETSLRIGDLQNAIVADLKYISQQEKSSKW